MPVQNWWHHLTLLNRLGQKFTACRWASLIQVQQQLQQVASTEIGGDSQVQTSHVCIQFASNRHLFQSKAPSPSNSKIPPVLKLMIYKMALGTDISRPRRQWVLLASRKSSCPFLNHKHSREEFNYTQSVQLHTCIAQCAHWLLWLYSLNWPVCLNIQYYMQLALVENPVNSLPVLFTETLAT